MSEVTKRYPVSVFWSDEDEGFIALAQDLPGCSAFGETAEEALRELEPAMEAWFEATTKAGNPIPKPSAPPTDQQHSGKVLLRMPRDLHTHLARAAETQNVSLNQYLVYVLASSIAATPVSIGAVRPARSLAEVQAATLLAELEGYAEEPEFVLRAHPHDRPMFYGGGEVISTTIFPSIDAPSNPSHVYLSPFPRARTARTIEPKGPVRARKSERAE